MAAWFPTGASVARRNHPFIPVCGSRPDLHSCCGSRREKPGSIRAISNRLAHNARSDALLTRASGGGRQGSRPVPRGSCSERGRGRTRRRGQPPRGCNNTSFHRRLILQREIKRAQRDRGRLADGVDARVDQRRVGDSVRNRLGTEVLEPVEERAHDRRGLDGVVAMRVAAFHLAHVDHRYRQVASAAESVIMPSRARPPCRRADS